jgi:Mrp family chromosome partitioning ATPase/capsular polysaccharide biosynthesis protein
MISELDTRSTDWLAPPNDEPALRRYFRTVRERWRSILLCVLLCVGASVLYLALTPKTYSAQADLLVTPIPSENDKTTGLGLIRASVDPTRDVSTVGQFVESLAVARAVAAQKILDESPRQLLGRVQAQPVAQSSVVSVTAKASSPELAAKLATAFAQGTVDVRTRQLHGQVAAAVPSLRAGARRLSQEELAQTDLPARISALESLRHAPDPTLQVSSKAEPAGSAVSPNTKLTLAAGLFVGLVVGLGGALALQSLDPRLRREEQIREIFRLPILARVPLESRSGKAGPLPPAEVSRATAEAYRTLRATFAAARVSDARTRSILITGATPSEGKSTTSLNFAYALGQADARGLLLETDLYRPALGRALGLDVSEGIGSVLVRESSLADAATTTADTGPNLGLVLAENFGQPLGDRLALPTALELVPDAERLADYVVIDAPPLTEVSDVLPLAKQASDVIIVARLGRSSIPRLRELGELLIHNQITPAGVVVVGSENRPSDYYYGATPTRQQKSGSRSSRSRSVA